MELVSPSALPHSTEPVLMAMSCEPDVGTTVPVSGTTPTSPKAVQPSGNCETSTSVVHSAIGAEAPSKSSAPSAKGGEAWSTLNTTVPSMSPLMLTTTLAPSGKPPLAASTYTSLPDALVSLTMLTCAVMSSAPSSV